MWNYEKIKAGFIRYYNENGHYPSALEIDHCPYLLTSRTIQRKWGGLEAIRQKMGLEITNYTKGEIRSTKSVFIGKRGYLEENKLEVILQRYFGEVFVHSQKRIGQVRADFFIYTPKSNFAIDIFCFEDKNCFLSDLNIKLKTYNGYPFSVIYLPINHKYSTDDILKWVNNKKNKLPTNQKVMSYEEFLKYIKTIKPYPNPLI